MLAYIMFLLLIFFGIFLNLLINLTSFVFLIHSFRKLSFSFINLFFCYTLFNFCLYYFFSAYFAVAFFCYLECLTCGYLNFLISSQVYSKLWISYRYWFGHDPQILPCMVILPFNLIFNIFYDIHFTNPWVI